MLREDFLLFVPVISVIIVKIWPQNLNTLKNIGINSNYLFGQGYDGAAAMSGNFKGIQAVIKETHHTAIYVHYSAHSLNLALAHSSNIHHIRNCIGTIKSVGNFIKNATIRTELLKNNIKYFFPQTKWTKLTSTYENRWIENHDGVFRVLEIYKPNVVTLEKLKFYDNITFCFSIAIPFYDDFISKLKDKFSKHNHFIFFIFIITKKVCRCYSIKVRFQFILRFFNSQLLCSELRS